MNYKKFDFSFNLRASVGNRIFNAVDASRAQYDAMENDVVFSDEVDQSCITFPISFPGIR